MKAIELKPHPLKRRNKRGMVNIAVWVLHCLLSDQKKAFRRCFSYLQCFWLSFLFSQEAQLKWGTIFCSSNKTHRYSQTQTKIKARGESPFIPSSHSCERLYCMHTLLPSVLMGKDSVILFLAALCYVSQTLFLIFLTQHFPSSIPCP